MSMKFTKRRPPFPFFALTCALLWPTLVHSDTISITFAPVQVFGRQFNILTENNSSLLVVLTWGHRDYVIPDGASTEPNCNVLDESVPVTTLNTSAGAHSVYNFSTPQTLGYCSFISNVYNGAVYQWYPPVNLIVVGVGTSNPDSVGFVLTDAFQSVMDACYNSYSVKSLDRTAVTKYCRTSDLRFQSTDGSTTLILDVTVQSNKTTSLLLYNTYLFLISFGSILVYLLVLNIADFIVVGAGGRTTKQLAHDFILNFLYMLFGGHLMFWVYAVVAVLDYFCLCRCMSGSNLFKLLPYWFSPYNREVYIVSDERDAQTWRFCYSGWTLLIVLNVIWIVITFPTLMVFVVGEQYFRCMRVISAIERRKKLAVRRKDVCTPLPGSDVFASRNSELESLGLGEPLNPHDRAAVKSDTVGVAESLQVNPSRTSQLG